MKCIDDWCLKNMNCPICRENFQKQILDEKYKNNVQINLQISNINNGLLNKEKMISFQVNNKS